MSGIENISLTNINELINKLYLTKGIYEGRLNKCEESKLKIEEIGTEGIKELSFNPNLGAYITMGEGKSLMGGNKNVEIIERINNYMKIMNSDIILKFITMMTNENEFRSMIGEGKLNIKFGDNKDTIKEILNIIFEEIDEVNINLLKDLQFINKSLRETSDYVDQIVNRDTNLYNNYNKSERKYICIYKLAKILDNLIRNNPERIDDLLQGETFKLTLKIVNGCNRSMGTLYLLHKKMNEKYNILNEYYERVIRSNQKVFAYIKYRCDTQDQGNKYNPRYNIQEKNGYIYMRYYNIDGKLGFKRDLSCNIKEEITKLSSIAKKEDCNKEYIINEMKDIIKRTEGINNLGESYDSNLAIQEAKEKGERGDKKEYYYFGKFDGIFNEKISNKEIAKAMSNNLIDKLVNGDPICIIGYGQSGSGKTSSLIYLKTSKGEQYGILVELSNELINKGYTNMKLKMKNLYVNYDSPNIINNMDVLRKEHNNIQELTFNNNNNEAIFIAKDNKWINIEEIDKEESEKRSIGKFINDGFEKRQVEPTPNNPNSSRSHVIVYLEFSSENRRLPNAKLIVCDLAGVENKFLCDDMGTIQRFNEQYIVSDKYNPNGKDKIIFDKYYEEQKPISGISIDLYKKNKEDYLKQINNFRKNVNLTNYQQGGETTDINISKQRDILECKKDFYHIDLFNSIKNKNDIENEYKKIINNFQEKINQLENQIKNIDKNKSLITKFKTITPRIFLGEMPKQSDWELLNNINNIIINESNIIEQIKKDPSNKIINLPKEVKSGLGLVGSNDMAKFASSKNIWNNNSKKILDLLEYIFNKNDNQISNIKNEINELNDIIKEYICDLERALKLLFNCNLRVNEGYLINRSLKDMRKSIKDIILSSSVKDNQVLPLVYTYPTLPYCRNIYMEEDNYERFYVEKPKMDNLSSAIINIIKDYGIELDKIYFGVFTVINLTNNGIVNNPPNPPYINLNPLKYLFNNYKEKRDEIRKELIKIKDIIFGPNSFKYYQDNKPIRGDPLFILSVIDTNEFTNEDVYGIINGIDNINASTLIGSLESTEILRNVYFDKYICSNINSTEVHNFINKIKEIPINKGQQTIDLNLRIAEQNANLILPNNNIDEFNKSIQLTGGYNLQIINKKLNSIIPDDCNYF